MQRSGILASLLQPGILLGILFVLLLSVHPTQLLAAQESLSDEEKETLQQAKDAEQQLKFWLGIAESRLKDVVVYTKKLDKAESAKQ